MSSALAQITPMGLLQDEYRKSPSIELAGQIVALQKAAFENEVARQRFEWEQQGREDVIAFGRAMSKFKDDVPVILRNRPIKDRQGNKLYDGVALEDVATPIMKALSALRITYRFKTADLDDGRTRVTCFLRLEGTAYEEEGSSLAAGVDISGGKDALKGVGSTVSYLEKYTLLASCGVHVHGTDPEAVPTDGISNEDGGEWVDNIREADTPESVMGIWIKGVEKAKSFTPIDYRAMTIFTEARDERLKQLRRSK